LLLVVWLVAYALIGGVVWVVSDALLLNTSIDDLLAIMIAGAMTIGIGWLGASWVQRRVEDAADARVPARQ
jgi:hypothetical protein